MNALPKWCTKHSRPSTAGNGCDGWASCPPVDCELVVLAYHDKKKDGEVAELLQALINTVEYVGTGILPARTGWSWYDTLSKHYPNHRLIRQTTHKTGHTTTEKLSAEIRKYKTTEKDAWEAADEENRARKALKTAEKRAAETARKHDEATRELLGWATDL